MVMMEILSFWRTEHNLLFRAAQTNSRANWLAELIQSTLTKPGELLKAETVRKTNTCAESQLREWTGVDY